MGIVVAEKLNVLSATQLAVYGLTIVPEAPFPLESFAVVPLPSFILK